MGAVVKHNIVVTGFGINQGDWIFFLWEGNESYSEKVSSQLLLVRIDRMIYPVTLNLLSRVRS